MGALTWFVGHLIGGLAGALVIFVILVALATFMYLRSRKTAVHADNVNDEWSDRPALFAVGIRSMAFGTGGDAEVGDAAHTRPHPLGRAVAVLCFAVVIVVALLGITYIVATGFGKTLSFEHIFPTITSIK